MVEHRQYRVQAERVGVDQHYVVDDAAAARGIDEQSAMQQRDPEPASTEDNQPHPAHTACQYRPWPWLHRPERG
jgi:hypothetical protein